MGDINKIFSTGTLSRIILIILFFLYLVFPSGSSTIDGWNYAANIKHAGEIFYPHHLLYNAFGYIISFLPAKAGIGVIECLKALNAIFAVLAFLMVQLILRRLGKDEFTVIIISCLAGFSFSVMRFATENETYIIPLFFSLTASGYYLKFLNTSTSKYAFYSGIWATISVLFHQIFIFWWLGIFTGILLSKKLKPVLWYGLVSIAGPMVYFIVILITTGNLGWETIIKFLSGDFPDNAQLGITGKGLLFSGISLIRSFVQVHGYILNMIRSYPLLLVPCILSSVLFFLALLKIPLLKFTTPSSNFAGIHILILILQFLFAILAAGNAEFMVMIPVLFFILLVVLFDNYEKFLLRIMAGIVIWNLAYGIIPLHFNLPHAEKYLCKVSLEKKQVIVIASDDQLIRSMIYYEEGNSKVENIYKSPAVMKLKGTNIRLLENVIDSALNKGLVIYTDCIGHRLISRASISEGSTNAEFFCKYQSVEIISWESIMGRRAVNRIIAKL